MARKIQSQRNDGNTIPTELALSKQVAKLFKQHWTRKQPNEQHCYSLAVAVNVVRQSNYVTKYEEHKERVRKRRDVLKSTMEILDREIETLKCDIEFSREHGLDLDPGDLTTLSTLTSLRINLDVAIGYLLRPYDKFSKKGAGRSWHRAAVYLARQAKSVLKDANNPKVAEHKHGEFVEVVKGLLELANIHYSTSVIAKVLEKNNPKSETR